MTTPAERLRRALPPKPKSGYEPGTVAADTAAVLDQLDARGTGLTPEETAARDALVMALAALPIDMGGNLRIVLAAFARLDAEVAAARLTLTEREVDYQAALAEIKALRTALDKLTKVYASAVPYQEEIDSLRETLGRTVAERDAALAALEALEAVRDAAALRGETL